MSTTIYSPTGLPIEVIDQSVSVWLAKGWTTTAPSDVSAPEKLPTAVASKQSSDVTAPGESEVELDEQDEE